MLNRHIASFLLLTTALAGRMAAPADVKSTSTFDDLVHDAKASGAKVVVLNIWGEHCSHCIAEMPALVQFAEKLKSVPGVELVGLGVPEGHKTEKESTAAIDTIVKKRKLTYANFAWVGSSDSLVEHFSLTGTPQTVLLDADGKILQQIDVPKDPAKVPDALLAVVNAALKKDEKK